MRLAAVVLGHRPMRHECLAHSAEVQQANIEGFLGVVDIVSMLLPKEKKEGKEDLRS